MFAVAMLDISQFVDGTNGDQHQQHCWPIFVKTAYFNKGYVWQLLFKL